MKTVFTAPMIKRELKPKPQPSQNNGETTREPAVHELAPSESTVKMLRQPPTQILSHLYLGSQANAANKKELHALEVTRILCVKEKNYASNPKDFKFLFIPMSDYGHTSLREVLPPCYEFIEDAREERSKVLVHCRGGVNRSAAVILAYLMKFQELTLQDALNYVKCKRPQISLCELYMRQLCELEVDMFGKGTVEHIEAPASLQDRIGAWRASREKSSSELTSKKKDEDGK